MNVIQKSQSECFSNSFHPPFNRAGGRTSNVRLSRWTESSLKNFYIEHLLFHEIGHHVDWYSRRWSKANRRKLEDAADQYAFSKTTKRSIIYKAEQTGNGQPGGNKPQPELEGRSR